MILIQHYQIPSGPFAVPIYQLELYTHITPNIVHIRAYTLFFQTVSANAAPSAKGRVILGERLGIGRSWSSIDRSRRAVVGSCTIFCDSKANIWFRVLKNHTAFDGLTYVRVRVP